MWSCYYRVYSITQVQVMRVAASMTYRINSQSVCHHRTLTEALLAAVLPLRIRFKLLLLDCLGTALTVSSKASYSANKQISNAL